MRGIVDSRWLMLAGLLLAQGPGFSQADQQRTLVLSGHSGQAPFIQINGRSYVAVDALARLMNGSIGYEGSQITLTLGAVPHAASLHLPGSPEIS